MRLRAIVCCLWFGLMPSWVYEPERHYDCSYWAHLRFNVVQAFVWLFFLENEVDRNFERILNKSWSSVNWFRWMKGNAHG